MDQSLIAAAQNGDIDALYELLGQKPRILEDVEQVPFSQTPLHIAVMAGARRFAMEIASLKPSFARKLNQDGLSPLHLASANGHMEIVKELLNISTDLCLLKGREKRTPLHCAAMAGGSIKVFGLLISACPESIKELTVRYETPLHLAVRNDQFEAFKALLKGLNLLEMETLVNWKDDEGNTVLHLASSRKQSKMVELLLCSSKIKWIVDINVVNISGATALDVLPPVASDPDVVKIKDILVHAGAKTARDMMNSHSIDHSQVLADRGWKKVPRIGPFMGQWKLYFRFNLDRDTPNDARNALLVVFVLIATATFQAGFSPPGGVTQSDDYPRPDIGPNKSYIIKRLLGDQPVQFFIFTLSNAVAFSLSFSMIAILTKSFPLRKPLLMALSCMYASYVCTVIATMPVMKYGSMLLVLLVTVLWLVSYLQLSTGLCRLYRRVWMRLTLKRTRGPPAGGVWLSV